MYAAAGGASLAGRKARRPGPAVAARRPSAAPRAFSCTHWETRLQPPPPPPDAAPAASQPLTASSECAQGRAAWQEAAVLAAAAGADGGVRRCSVPGAETRADRKWKRRNRVRDASYGSSSESEGESEPWRAAGATRGAARLLYVGLCVLALGLVVSFVGTGDKGFKTPALRMVGPALVAGGLACCALRILLCACHRPCCSTANNVRDIKENRRLFTEEVPLAARPSGAAAARCSPARRRPDASSGDVSSISSGEEPRAGPSRARPELVLSPAQLRA